MTKRNDQDPNKETYDHLEVDNIRTTIALPAGAPVPDAIGQIALTCQFFLDKDGLTIEEAQELFKDLANDLHEQLEKKRHGFERHQLSFSFLSIPAEDPIPMNVIDLDQRRRDKEGQTMSIAPPQLLQ